MVASLLPPFAQHQTRIDGTSVAVIANNFVLAAAAETVGARHIGAQPSATVTYISGALVTIRTVFVDEGADQVRCTDIISTQVSIIAVRTGFTGNLTVLFRCMDASPKEVFAPRDLAAVVTDAFLGNVVAGIAGIRLLRVLRADRQGTSKVPKGAIEIAVGVLVTGIETVRNGHMLAGTS